MVTLAVLIARNQTVELPSYLNVALDSGVAPGENTCRQLGGALAVAVFGALVAHRETFVPGMQVSLVIAAVLLLVTTAASLLLHGKDPDK